MALVKLWKEFTNRSIVVLLHDHVDTDDHVGKFVWLVIGINLCLKVVLSNCFQEAKNKFHGEQREHLSDLSLDSFEDLQLFF